MVVKIVSPASKNLICVSNGFTLSSFDRMYYFIFGLELSDPLGKTMGLIFIKVIFYVLNLLSQTFDLVVMYCIFHCLILLFILVTQLRVFRTVYQLDFCISYMLLLSWQRVL